MLELKNRKILLIALLSIAAIASSIAFAQSSGIGYYGEGTGLQIRLTAWSGLITVAILAIVLVNALFYAIGHAFSIDSVKRYAESELLQVTVSTLLIALSVMILMVLTAFALQAYKNSNLSSCSELSGMFLTFSQPPIETDPENPLDYVDCNVRAKILALENLYNVVYESNLPTERSAYSCQYLFGLQIYCGYFDLQQEVETAHLYAAKIVPLLTLLQGERALIQYIGQNMLPIFMSLGLVLRMFQFTRGIGGLFIALALGFYFVFPLVYVVIDPTQFKDVASYVQPLPESVSQQCYDTFAGSVTLISLAQMDTNTIVSLFEDIGGMLAELTLGVVFYPFIAFSVTLLFVNTTAPILGGDAGDIVRAVSKIV